VIATVRSRLRRTRHWVRQHLEVVVNEHGTSDQQAMLAKGEQGLLFEPEITAKIAKHKWRIYEVPITYAGRTYEEGKKITWKDGLQALWCIIRYKFTD